MLVEPLVSSQSQDVTPHKIGRARSIKERLQQEWHFTIPIACNLIRSES